MEINDLIESLNGMVKANLSEIPSIKAMDILAEHFRDLKLPLVHIGKIKFDIDQGFFDDEDKAKEAIRLFALVILRMKQRFEDEFGEDIASYVLGDSMVGMKITYHS